MLEYQAKDLVFHFNKKHLEDNTIPMWCVKSHGVTFYVNHVSSELPWSTKETPDNPSTKGSIKFKQCKLTITRDNNATISKLGLFDKLLPRPRAANRIFTACGDEFHNALTRDEYSHSTIKEVVGECGNKFVICDLLDKDEMLLAAIVYAGKFRLLTTNEKYYFAYEEDEVIFENYDDDDDDDDEDDVDADSSKI